MSEQDEFFKKMEENIELEDKAQKSHDATYNLSATRKAADLKGDTAYDIIINDVHGDYEGLKEFLEIVKYIPNARIKFLGDYGKIAKVGSKTSAHNSKSVQVEVDGITWAIKSSGIDINKIDLFTSGNHEDRYFDDGGVELSRMVARSLGIEHVYARSMGYVLYDWVDFKDKVKTTTFGVYAGHGEGKSGNPGKEIDQSFNSTFFPGARVIIKGDSHKQVNGNQILTAVNHNQKGLVERPITYFNSGTFLSEEDYLQEKGFGLRAKFDGTILRYKATANKETNKVDVSVDQINIRQLISEVQKNYLNQLTEKCHKLEEADFENIDDIKEKYLELSRSVKEPAGPQKHNRYPSVLRFVSFCGTCIGNDEIQNIEDLKAKVETIKKLDNVKVFLNGNMIAYKQADFWKKEKYPEDSFARIQELAEIFEPIKDKIVAINFGNQERDIMKWHAQDLAQLAMKELQLKESEAYEHKPAQALKLEINKIRGAKCVELNEAILSKAVESYGLSDKKLKELMDFAVENAENTELEEILKKCNTSKGYNENRLTTKDIEKILVIKLRKEGKLYDLSNPKHVRKIDLLVKDKIVSLRKPNEFLIQNILCKLWGISPKTITMTSDPKQDNHNYFKITDANGDVKILNVTSCYHQPLSTRGVISSNLTQRHTGADIFLTNGSEYVERGRSASIDEDGQRHVDDVINISAGRFDKPSSVNKIYEIRVEKASGTRIESGIFADTNDTITTVSSISYENAEYEASSQIFKESCKDIISKSLLKAIETFKTKKTKKESQIEKSVLKALESNGKE